MLSRVEQENLAVKFEREYGNLLMTQNKGVYEKEELHSRAMGLANDIKSIAKDKYFEPDIIAVMDGIFLSIKNIN